jgi:DNA ligase (NAD+)
LDLRLEPSNEAAYSALVRELNRLSRIYYQQHQSEVSDEVFDHALAHLVACETQHPSWILPDSPSQRVGEVARSDLANVLHEPRLYSLANSYSAEDLAAFDRRLREQIFPQTQDGSPDRVSAAPSDLAESSIAYHCELKLDGVSLSIVYEDGLFVQAATRGDGLRGEDVTAQARTLRGLPQRLEMENPPKRVILRGEVVMSHSVLKELNAQRAKEGLKLFANPRNTASGSLKLKDPSEVSKRRLEIYLYDLALLEGSKMPETQAEQLQWMRDAGLPVFQGGSSCQGLTEVLLVIERFQTLRSTLPVDVDGVVIKLQKVSKRQAVGYTIKFPRWAMAYKFPAEVAVTRLLKITLNVGRTGAVTPVALLAPVQLAGSMVSRATLHNEDEIRRHGLREGLLVYLEKGGDVIPKITGLAESAGDRPLYEMPKQCPACATTLCIDEEAVVKRCPNETCSGQRLARLEHFVGRQALDIEGLGSRLLELLCERNRLKDVSDLYTLTVDELAKLERMGEKSARKVLASLRFSFTMEPERLLFALGVRHVGASVARALLARFATLHAVFHALEEELLEVDDVGPQVVKSLMTWRQTENAKNLLTRLESAGFDFHRRSQMADPPKEGTFAGKRVVLTGRFEMKSRKEIKADLLLQGAKVSAAVSAKSDFLVAGLDAGSKVQKAKDLGVTILDESAYFALLETKQATSEENRPKMPEEDEKPLISDDDQAGGQGLLF